MNRGIIIIRDTKSKLLITIFVIFVLTIAACGQESSSSSAQNIEATVEARVEATVAAQLSISASAAVAKVPIPTPVAVTATPVATTEPTATPNIQATVTAIVADVLASRPTPTAIVNIVVVTATPIPTPPTTSTLVPTATPLLLITPVPTATLVPTTTPVPTTTQIPTPTPTDTPSSTATPPPTPSPTSMPATPTPKPATIVNSQILTATTTWTLNDSPYLVKGNVRVNQGVMLTIDAGVDIQFTSHAGLEILGTLSAIGTATQTISFSPSLDVWRGIRFRAASSDYEEGEGSVIEWSNINIGTSEERSGDSPAITIQDSAPKISHNRILGSAFSASLVLLEGGHPEISHNTIQCTVWCLNLLRRNSGERVEHVLNIRNNTLMGESSTQLVLISMRIDCNDGVTLSLTNNSILGGPNHRKGIELFNCSNVIFKNNAITDFPSTADGAGLTIKGFAVETHIQTNHFEGNYISIRLEGVGNTETLTISQNNFINDNGFAIQLRDVPNSVVIPVTDSYWGTTDPTAISDMIFDNLDDFNLGTVNVINPVPSKIDISSE